MNPQHRIPAIWLTLGIVATLTAAEFAPGGSPADHLPLHIRQVTWFGERADWSHDGSRILFLSKTFGDAMELDLARQTIRNRTAHYAHHGRTRALYLTNGDMTSIKLDCDFEGPTTNTTDHKHAPKQDPKHAPWFFMKILLDAAPSVIHY